jgi:hypothetical protein
MITTGDHHMNLHEIFLVFSLVLALLAAFGYWPRAQPIVWLGGLFPLAFAFFIASLMVGGFSLR